MELIKPFIRYSKMYRRATDERVKSFIYDKWSDEVNVVAAVDSSSSSSKMQMCGYCHTSAATAFCDICLFPLAAACDEELATYCLLSVCYFESVCASASATTTSHRIVYRQRLKMTWYEHERPGKVYRVIYRKCFQCKRLTNDNVDDTYIYFDDSMFCSNCMFPLFQIHDVR
ncbi:hypothetical protein [Alphabaculovirus myunipunctae]|uniref:Ac52 n=1 Tax=Mythimna unipuncta nucleopolyhedrovirus TaxID=447897 RepID=A0A2K9VSG3_9ABAC|nr:hypothetical protein [Mythimna unipuncta nucleopolyhedrovirus]AUV65384.1 hypothetical protein [Mythimna unipuncta nucleopolyhedrovirus]